MEALQALIYERRYSMATPPIKVVKIEDIVAALEEMKGLGKDWWKSKTLWGAVVTVGVSIPVFLGYLTWEQSIAVESAALAAVLAMLRLGQDTPIK
jgi:formate-dependent nitrite reductase membrane component NrfD